MSSLIELKSSISLHDLADLLEFTPSGMTYVLYKKPADAKYYAFDIIKRNGGVRRINAPYPDLMLLQRRLSDLLQNCTEEINIARKRRTNWRTALSATAP